MHSVSIPGFLQEQTYLVALSMLSVAALYIAAGLRGETVGSS